MKSILVLCTGNSCRSQIAHGFLTHYAGAKAVVYSAGIETHGVNPRAIATMKEVAIDLQGHSSNLVDEYLEIPFDFIISVCDLAAENCPVFPSKTAIRLHHNFSDPSKLQGGEQEIQAAFRKTREEISTYCQDFVAKYLD
jgi:arsenate reductase